MTNDEAVRVIADELVARHLTTQRDVAERVATAAMVKLSRLEQSRVERTMGQLEVLRRYWASPMRVFGATCPEALRLLGRQAAIVAEQFSGVLAILTAQDPSAGSAEAKARDVDASQSVEPGGRSSPPPAAPAEQVCLIRAGYCACGPHQAPATTPGGVTYCSRCGCGIETDLPAEPSPRIELLDVPINDHKPTLNPPAEVKPSDCPIVLPEILARNIIRDAERMGDADRWRFLDEAAMRILPHVSDAPTAAANIAYNCAEALWAERQKRIDEQHARGRK
jgi:hypothetical protein